MRGHLFNWSLVLFGLLLVVLWAPSAEGKKPGKLITVAESSNDGVTGVGTVATETALCPAGTRAVGGGFLLSSGIAFESRMVGVNAWRVSAQNRTNGHVGVVAYAYCRRRAPKTIAVSRTSIAGAAGAGPSAIAKCPRGRKAVAGGFAAGLPVESGLVDNVVTDSLRLGADRWRTQILSGKTGATVTGYAYCAKREKAPPARTASAPTVTGDLTPTSVRSPSCGNQTAVMGGFSQVGATGLSTAFPAYTVSKRAGTKTWNVGATDVGGGPLTVSATVYCG